MFATRESRVSSDSVPPMMSTCANTTPKQVLKARKDKKSSAREFSKNTSRVHSRLSETTTMEIYQITFSSTEMV